ncbi:MAG TPA: hypothetical protein VKZ63_15385 [Kofleriaceae bacterium]|nr:hypothetical protein [Kofleriaceae bacterium]
MGSCRSLVGSGAGGDGGGGDAEAQRRAEEEAARKKAAEGVRQAEEDRKKKQEEERKKYEEQQKKWKEDQERAWEEQTKREREQAREREKSGGSGGGTSEAERRRVAQANAEAERQRRINQGFQDQRESQETNRQLGDNLAAGAGAVFMTGGGERPSPFSQKKIQLEFGFGGRFWPVMADNSGDDIMEFSSQDTAGGFNLELRLQYWPVHRSRFGVGVAGHAGAAGIAMPGGAMYGAEAGAGLRAYLGSRTGWNLRGEAGVIGRHVGTSANLFGAIVSGSGSYQVRRLGVGVRRCLASDEEAEEHCETHVGLTVLADHTDLADAALVYRADFLTLMGFGVVGIDLELGTAYPAPGDTSYPLDEDRLGLYVAFILRKAWTWY